MEIGFIGAVSKHANDLMSFLCDWQLKPIGVFESVNTERRLSSCDLKQGSSLNPVCNNSMTFHLWPFRLHESNPFSFWMGYKSDFGWQCEQGQSGLLDFAFKHGRNQAEQQY